MTRFDPDFRVLIDGAPVPAPMRASIERVSLEAGLEGADRVELSLVNENLRWLDHPLLASGRELTLELGYVTEGLVQLFVGEITGQSASFPSSGAPSLVVSAHDRTHHLRTGKKSRWFAVPITGVGNTPLPDLAVASWVAVENALIPIPDPVSAALSVLVGYAEAAVQLSETDSVQRMVRKQEGDDYRFLRQIAAENGWELLIDHSPQSGGHQLRFTSALDQLDPDVTLAWGRSLIDFTPRVAEVGQIASISATVWVPQIKTGFTVTVGWDWDAMALDVRVVPGLMPGVDAEAGIYWDEPMTAASAPRKLLSKLVPKLNERLTASGSTVGDPRIRPGGVVRIEGVGQTFGGLYRVSSVEHGLDSGGFTTRFSLRKEIWFGSIPLPAQGAVPVHLDSPLGRGAIQLARETR